MKLPVITLTILEPTFEAFAKEALQAEKFVDYVQIDVMDGKFVPNISFHEIEKINSLKTKLTFELHLMVADPIAEMRRWQIVENVTRVLFHLESVSDPLRPISFARKEGWDVGIVINPETPLTAVEPYLNKIDVLQFMTVHPGKQGSKFEDSVLTKIREFTKLKKRPLCAVDGGVDLKTAPKLLEAGVEIFNVGSFFTKASNMEAAYQELCLSLREPRVYRGGRSNLTT